MMIRRNCSNDVDSGMLAAKEALREAARTIAKLARQEPRLRRETDRKTQNNKLETEHPKLKIVHVSIHPTGHHETDVRNIEDAIARAGPGGTVLLKANGKDGKPCSFNLTMVTDLTLPYEISLKSEKNAQIKFSEGL